MSRKYEYEQTIAANTTKTIKWGDVVSHTLGNSLMDAATHQFQTDNAVTIKFLTGTQTTSEDAFSHSGLDAYDVDGVSGIQVTTGSNATLVTIYGR